MSNLIAARLRPSFFYFYPPLRTMLLTLTSKLVFLNSNYTLIALDPLEQFDVLALPVIGGGLTNLSLLLALNILLMSA